MNARNDTHEKLDLHAEVYHRTKIDALRAEGKRLRDELRRRGIDPGWVLLQAGLLPPEQAGFAMGN